MSGPRLALLLLQIAAGVGLAIWLWRSVLAPSAPRRPPDRVVVASLLGALAVTAVLAVLGATGQKALGTAILILVGAVAIVAAVVRSRHR